jgi:hypothetical protein
MQVSKRFCTLTSPKSNVRKTLIRARSRRRPVCPGQMTQILRAVLLPFIGGFHCGNSCAVWMISVSPIAPAVQRRAPLRRGGGPYRTMGLPACSRRSAAAPLRLFVRSVNHKPVSVVLPPFNGGLHCGRNRGGSAACVAYTYSRR